MLIHVGTFSVLAHPNPQVSHVCFHSNPKLDNSSKIINLASVAAGASALFQASTTYLIYSIVNCNTFSGNVPIANRYDAIANSILCP